MDRQDKIIAAISVTLPIFALALYYWWLPENIENIKELAKAHSILVGFFVITWRFIAVVVPPIPGGIVSLALLPIIGWWESYLYAVTGVLSGITVAFFLARRYREKIVRKFVPLKQIKHWENRLSEKQEFWAFLGIRFLSSPVLDFVSYVAGLSRISFKKFFLISAIGMVPEALLFYFGEEVYKKSASTAIIILILVALAAYTYKVFHLHKKITRLVKKTRS